MNREMRRKINKRLKLKAEQIWALETQINSTINEREKGALTQEINQIVKDCSYEDLLLIDEFLISLHGTMS